MTKTERKSTFRLLPSTEGKCLWTLVGILQMQVGPGWWHFNVHGVLGYKPRPFHQQGMQSATVAHVCAWGVHFWYLALISLLWVAKRLAWCFSPTYNRLIRGPSQASTITNWKI